MIIFSKIFLIYTAPVNPSEILQLKSNLLDTIKIETLNAPPTPEQKEQLLKTVNQLCKQFPTELLSKFNGIIEYYKKTSEAITAIEITGPQKELNELKDELKEVKKKTKQAQQDKDKVLIEVLKPSFEIFFTSDIQQILKKMTLAISKTNSKEIEQNKKEFELGKIEYATYMQTLIKILNKIAEKSPQDSTAKKIAERMVKELNLKKSTISGLRWNPDNKTEIIRSLNGQIEYNTNLVNNFNDWVDKLPQ